MAMIKVKNEESQPYFICTCVGIHPGGGLSRNHQLSWPRLQARRSCASSLETFTQSFLHLAWPMTHGPESGSRSDLIVVAHIFSWSWSAHLQDIWQHDQTSGAESCELKAAKFIKMPSNSASETAKNWKPIINFSLCFIEKFGSVSAFDFYF